MANEDVLGRAKRWLDLDPLAGYDDYHSTKLIRDLAAALREARTDKKYWERVANCLLSTCTDAQSDAAIGAAIEQGAIDAAMKPPGGEGSGHE